MFQRQYQTEHWEKVTPQETNANYQTVLPSIQPSYQQQRRAYYAQSSNPPPGLPIHQPLQIQTVFSLPGTPSPEQSSTNLSTLDSVDFTTL